MKRQAPDLIGSGHGQQQGFFVWSQHEAIWTGNVLEQTVDLTIFSQAKDPTRWVLKSSLALVSEIKVAV